MLGDYRVLCDCRPRARAAIENCPRFDRTLALAGGASHRPRHTPISETFSRLEVITGTRQGFAAFRSFTRSSTPLTPSSAY
jgi:hypothetical protein